MASGMMSGVTSPARPWFKLATPYDELNQMESVKKWLHDVSNIISVSFLRSNLYNSLPIIYGDMGAFGTAALFIDEDSEEVFQTFPMAIGSYSIANNEKLRIDVFTRTFKMTVRQIVSKFGKDETSKIDWSNISEAVKEKYESGLHDEWVEVCHTVKPNQEYSKDKLESEFKKYISIYYEKDSKPKGGEDVYLSKKGYDYFPVLCPRWEVNGGDAYGTDCPGMVALGDVKQLQQGERKTLQALEKMINPPLVGSSNLRNQKVSLLPGDVNYDDTPGGVGGLRALHEVNFRVDLMENKQQQVRHRIQRAFFEDLFLMLASSDRRQITAREIEERHEEKLLALGPVLEQLNQDLLDPLIDIAFDLHIKQGLLPEIPEELSGVVLKVEYISVMAQAQKLITIGAVDRFTQYAGQVASFDPSVLDKISADKLIETYGDITSIPPGIVKSDEEVQAAREAQAQAQAQAQQMQQMQQMAGAAQNLGKTPMGQDSALDRMIDEAGANQISEGFVDE